MEELSTGDWTLIARVLNEEASQQDLVQLEELAHRTQNLREEMDVMRQRMSIQPTRVQDVFNADLAFNKLHQRIKTEGLI